MHFHAFVYLNCLGTFSSVSFFLLHSLVYVSASRHQNVSLLHLETLFVPTYLRFLILPPSSVQFRDEDARKAFSENFSQRGVHSEHRVILSNFSDTDLPTIIYSWGWESLCDVPVTCPTMLIQEFYFNMHGLDYSVPIFHTCV